jgi:hypothetical protein
MFTVQKMCEQRAYDMNREDERMAMLRKKKETEMRFGTPRSSRKVKFKDFSLRGIAEFQDADKTSDSPRSPHRVGKNAQGGHVALPPALTVPERHSLSLQKYLAHQQAARSSRRPSPYPQFGMEEQCAQKRHVVRIHVKKPQAVAAG